MSVKPNKLNGQHLTARRKVYFLLFLSFLLSMKLWLGWEGRLKYVDMLIVVSLIFLIRVGRIKLDFTLRNVGMCLAILMAHLLTSAFNLVGLLYFVCFQVPLYVVIVCLEDFDKIRCLGYITKCFGYLMIPSVMVYCLWLLVDIPHLGIQRAYLNDWAILKGYGVCENYLFFMHGINSSFRFNGPFLEPGHLGMIAAFLLFVNKFNFRQKGMWMILLALALTLSLAGYVLAFIAFGMIYFYRGKIRLGTLVFGISVICAVYLFAQFYNGGENVIYEKIFSRLEPDEDKGIAGNNRVFGQIDLYFATLWFDRHTMLWGYPQEEMEYLADTGSRGTGFIMWMCSHGVIGTCAVAFIYVLYYLYSVAKRFAILCLTFVALMFFQRSYPFWTSWIICYVYGIVAEEKRLMKVKNEGRHSYIPPQS